MCGLPEVGAVVFDFLPNPMKLSPTWEILEFSFNVEVEPHKGNIAGGMEKCACIRITTDRDAGHLRDHLGLVRGVGSEWGGGGRRGRVCLRSCFRSQPTTAVQRDRTPSVFAQPRNPHQAGGCRGTSLIRKRAPVGPCSRSMPRALPWS